MRYDGKHLFVILHDFNQLVCHNNRPAWKGEGVGPQVGRMLEVESNIIAKTSRLRHFFRSHFQTVLLVFWQLGGLKERLGHECIRLRTKNLLPLVREMLGQGVHTREQGNTSHYDERHQRYGISDRLWPAPTFQPRDTMLEGIAKLLMKFWWQRSICMEIAAILEMQILQPLYLF